MNYIVNGKKDQYEVVIGCEVHAQISSKSKLFSRSATKFGVQQNSQVSLIDAAMPGMLPVVNRECVRKAVKTGLALNGKINCRSVFDRKNYFYPDLPQGYQISQYYEPIVGEGYLEIDLGDGLKKQVGIERIHLEQDAGKSIHDQDPTLSLVDLNRSGIALMEIVTKPDLSSPAEAADFVKALRSIMRTLETCDGDMEKGNLRCDANVSVKRVGEAKLGTRCEIKNLNSVRNIMRAIEFEAQRQVDIIEDGGSIDQETRLFDTITGETRTMRSKEDAMDYRYFPDPDLPPLIISERFIDEIRQTLPELPEEKAQRYVAEFGISSYDAKIIALDADISDYFEDLISKKHDPKMCVTWLTVELFGRLNKLGLEITNLKFGSNQFAELLDLMANSTISGKIAKDVLDIMIETGEAPSSIVAQKGLSQISNLEEIEAIIDNVLANNQSSVDDYRAGKDKLFGFFVGQVMKESKGKANPQLVNQLLLQKLKS